ncbi:tetratricopeptide repeat protein [Candidatus Poriferisodalis sp.]|uniref:tetratricopeptide repeat protein n=1 Tax=Candidatus Poriferisodalis sp. TaxID=3101277 RepID=UPI003B527AF7
MAYFDLGSYGRPVTTQNPEAQLWFDRGMAWCYGFNHEEAIACFERALEHDPGCAMAHWGIAYAIGPNYNKPWEAFDDEEKRDSLECALAAVAAAADAASSASDAERALIGALAQRYPPSPDQDDFGSWNDAYADAMREVYRAHSNDLDVCALFAEAIMNRTPWELWDLVTGEPPEGAGTLEAIEVLEAAFETLDAEGANNHPGLLHMYVHLMEMSPHPERALSAGDRLVDLMPDAGHLIHMPTHIDVLCGHYLNVVARNSAAIVADRKYLEREGPMNFYSAYRCHDYHFKVYGAMFAGQYAPALEAAEEMIRTLPAELLQTGSPPMADWLEGFVPVKQHVLIRFGKWHEILSQALPEDPELYCVTTAMMRYARTVALASTGQVDDAESEREAFLAACDQVPASRTLFNNTCEDILAVAEAMLTGEVEYRRGSFDVAFDHLRRAVELDDNLPYDEPWGWMQPARHALGALLLEQGRTDEAEAAYRADLGLDGQLRRACQHPDNLWSLHGLHECLIRRGDTVEAPLVRQRLDLAVAHADVPITASCFCRLEGAASA